MCIYLYIHLFATFKFALPSIRHEFYDGLEQEKNILCVVPAPFLVVIFMNEVMTDKKTISYVMSCLLMKFPANIFDTSMIM